MSPVQELSVDPSTDQEVEISAAAVRSYARLLHAVGHRIHTYGTRDGGLICEDRSSLARPTIWRILGDGTIVADAPYSFVRRAFVPAEPPVPGRVPAETAAVKESGSGWVASGLRARAVVRQPSRGM
jgi:hypothetical protein